MKKMKISHYFSSTTLKIACLLSMLLASIVSAAPRLNGVAIHSELGSEQFIAGLYASTLTKDRAAILNSREEKSLQVRILNEDLSSRRFRRMWIEGMAINSSSAELEKYAEDMATFSNMIKIKMIEGDIFTVDRTEEEVRVSINGTRLGIIDDPFFFDLLLRTWIGPVPLSSDFRENLLAGGDISPELVGRFEATAPTDARIAAIEEAINAKRASQSEQQVASTTRTGTPKPDISPPSAIDTGTSLTTPPSVAIAPPSIGGDSGSATSQESTQNQTGDPAPTPDQAALSTQTETPEDSVFEDEADEEEFTAESLLKEQLYYTQLSRYTNKYIEYPRRALDRGHEGNVRLRVTIDRKGEVKNTEILAETEHRTLNREAERAVQRATPYPAMPDYVAGDDYSFTFTIAFKLQ